MPMPRRPHRASPDELKIIRAGEAVVTAYADPKVATTHFTVGREKLAAMTDEDIRALWNEHIEARDEQMSEYEHVAVEVLQVDRRWITSSAVTNGRLAATSFGASFSIPRRKCRRAFPLDTSAWGRHARR